jgi:hypothetical protein
MYMPKGKADITNTKQGDKAMTNIFEETYNTMRAAQRAFKAAATDEGRNAAEAAYKEAEDRITKEGDTAWKLWRAYEISRENEILNFDDIIWNQEVEPLTACMRENGIEAFTYSCRATDAVETLWLFKEAGCRIGEMVEVNLRKDLWGNGYEKGHAFKMSLN